jgi:hypothetical protein
LFEIENAAAFDYISGQLQILLMRIKLMQYYHIDLGLSLFELSGKSFETSEYPDLSQIKFAV